MRNGNSGIDTKLSGVDTVLTVPMRNGNPSPNIYLKGKFEFLPYLWGMETNCQVVIKHSLLVLTVPMRNGNIWNWTANTPKNRSYRTYEEWKLRLSLIFLSPSHSSYRTYEEWKLYIPDSRKRLTAPFLPYLWGMETIIERGWMNGWYWFLPYLWGMETMLHSSPMSHKISFLPYLWGMETQHLSQIQSHVSKFLPYLWGMETWKWLKWLRKQRKFLPYLWGMETLALHSTHLTIELVLTVPMRNGNFSYKYLITLVKTVLTVPMRNGNPHQSIFRCTRNARFLPYLWGMETNICWCSYYCNWWVLTVPMRNGNTFSAIQTPPLSPLVLTVPMRNGNDVLEDQAVIED